jgi:hypothetical protein
MKFTFVAVSKTTIRVGVAVTTRLCITQRVGVARISTLKFFEIAMQTTEYFGIYLSPKTPVIYAFLGSSLRFPVKSLSSQKKI